MSNAEFLKGRGVRKRHRGGTGGEEERISFVFFSMGQLVSHAS